MTVMSSSPTFASLNFPYVTHPSISTAAVAIGGGEEVACDTASWQEHNLPELWLDAAVATAPPPTQPCLLGGGSTPLVILEDSCGSACSWALLWLGLQVDERPSNDPLKQIEVVTSMLSLTKVTPYRTN